MTEPRPPTSHRVGCSTDLAHQSWTRTETNLVPTIAPPPSLPPPIRPAEIRPALPRSVDVAFASTHSTAPVIATATAAGAGALESAVAAGDILETGAQGGAVRDLQHRLGRLGYSVGVDGNLGPATTATVKQFQQDAGVSTTGRVGPTTLLALRVAEARRPDIAISGLFPSVGAGKTLGMGDRGIEVETLQRLLTLAGHSVEVDGAFGNATRTALQDFQRSQRITTTGELGPTTLQALNARVDALAVDVVAALDLPPGYGSLEKLATRLVALDARFSPTTSQGRAALAMALAIGGTEVYGQGTTGTDFFTVLGGTDNNMRGFAQFNLDYHDAETSTPQRYVTYLADILHGVERMPNSDPAADHVDALVLRIADGRVRTGDQLRSFLDGRGFGGTNWQGIDDGWGRNPGLADALVRFLQSSAPTVAPVFT
jgi:peptidoglycan hydrolase-like protein with peptidoglycan-binding domain